MSEIVPQVAVAPSAGPTREERLRRICLLDYLLHIVGLILSVGTLSVVAVIINHVKRGEAAGTIYESHMTWMIRTFWWTVLWVVLITPIVVASLFLMVWLYVIPGLWFLYRMVKGLLRLTDHQPIG